MSHLLDAVYGAALAASAPRLIGRPHLRRKFLGTPAAELPPSDRPRAWFHGVSVGEIHLLDTLIAAFRRRHPDWSVAVSVSTAAGHEEARRRFADVPMLTFPFDFTWAVRRTFEAVDPSLIVLSEGELWPNFLAEASRRRVPTAVVNARLSPRSFARHRRLRRLARPLLLGRVDRWAAQSDEYADRLRELGVAADRVTVTGSVKYDGAARGRDNPATASLRRLLNLRGDDVVWVAGSTHSPEERIVLDAFRRLRVHHPALRLILVPRKPERFGEVAGLLDREHFHFVRRGELTSPASGRPAVFLLDTVGELGAAWGLADIGFVGGSLDGRRGGQSMIEPAGYGVPCVFGPSVWNFRDPAARLLAAGGCVQVKTPADVLPAVRRMLRDPIGRARTGEAARRLVRDQQGATGRTLEVLAGLMPAADHGRRKAG